MVTVILAEFFRGKGKPSTYLKSEEIKYENK